MGLQFLAVGAGKIMQRIKRQIIRELFVCLHNRCLSPLTRIFPCLRQNPLVPVGLEKLLHRTQHSAFGYVLG